MPILHQRAMLLVKIETTSGVDAAPLPTTDAIFVISPEMGGDVKFLERKFSKRDFSLWPAIAGRKIGTLKFSVELAPTGNPGVAPRWTRLLQACAMQSATQTTISRTLTSANRASNVITFTTTAAHGFSVGNMVLSTVTGDATLSGMLQIVSIPTTTTFTVANTGPADANSSGGTVALVAGTLFTPTTDNQQTVTLYLYYDGLLHKITGAMGEMSLQADAGMIGDAMFTFTGIWNDPINVGSFPTGETFDTVTNVPIVEYANFSFGSQGTLVANQFKFAMQNKVLERPDMNQGSGWRGVRISDRNPTGGIDPEVEVTQTFWQQMTTATLGSLTLTVGNNSSGVNPGYSMVFSAPAVQIMKNTYKDRDNLRTYDLSLSFRRYSAAGNDEFSLLFT